ncbi:MAG: glycosyl hydrolase 53 family protein [Coprobacillus sp.]|nr:glycosyl hydrolase 53 family protein [Coprobacillus sp.]
MNNIKKSLILLPVFALLLAGCTPSDDNPVSGDIDSSESDSEKGSDDGSGDTSGSGPVTTYDAAYALYGDFADSSWNDSPSEDSDFYLAYSSTDSSTKYWSVTVTTSSEPVDNEWWSDTNQWDAGFRIVVYGDYNTTVAGYTELSSSSSADVRMGSDSNNIALDWNTTYVITIDMRTSASIKIDYPSTSSSGEDDGSVSVGKIDEIANNDNYIMGVDVSSIYEVLNAGAVYYDWAGNAITSLDDFMSFLASQGVNYVRIRLWNSPYVTAGDSTSGSFEGGGNDLDTDLLIAKAAADAGMKICLDFHYSDFWADPEKQTRPREWMSLSESEVISKGASWTSEVLNAFKNVGASPSMVQVGNETNNNTICGFTANSTNAVSFFKSCCSAVRTFDQDIKIVIHYADSRDYFTWSSYYQTLINQGVDYDVIGLSYYPFYHESMSSFSNTLKSYVSGFSSKEVCVMEYSYAYTLDYKAWNTGYGKMSNTFNADLETAGGYDATIQGQASVIHDVNEAVAQAGGIGTFYWEPAWLSKTGTSWASSNALNYYQQYADSTATADWFDTCTWANQALFDYDGYPLDSLKAFDQMKNGETIEEHYVSGNLSFTGTIDTGSDRTSQLPTSTEIYTTLGRNVTCNITWNSEDLAALNSASDGQTVVVHGSITFGGETLTVTGTYTLFHEYIVNGSFENGTSNSGTSSWTLTGSGHRFAADGNARTGSWYYNPYNSQSISCGIYQEVLLSAGTYTFECYWRTDSGTNLTFTLYASVGEVTLESSVLPSGSSYSTWINSSISFTVSSSSTVRVGLNTVGNGGAWAHVDDFSLHM